MTLPAPNHGIMDIQPYKGGDVTPEGMFREIALSSNENPYSPPQAVLDAIIKHLPRLNLYPKGAAPELRSSLTHHFDLDPQRILTSNGSESILHLIGRVYLDREHEAIIPECGFPIYKIIAQARGAKPILFPQPNLKIEPDHVLEVVTKATKIIFLDNPANPLGTYLPKEGLLQILNTVPSHVLVVHDGAYAEYMTEVPDYTSGLELVDRYPNLIVTRTFSKMYALAGLRLGWCYASQDIIDALFRVREPFSVSSLAQEAGIVALDEIDWINKVRKETIETRTQFADGLRALGITVGDSATNFVLPKFPGKVQDVYQFLGQNGVIVRPMAGKIQEHLRISIGKPDHMNKVLAILKQIN